MTAQVGDIFNVKGKEYSLVAISKNINFKPQKYGITPQYVCTACWSGYWCEYNITEDRIFLQNLYINSADNNYPDINGVSVESDNHCMEFDYMGHHAYKNLNMPVNYTGKILVGNGFIEDYYIHMGFQRAWAYKDLKEFVFHKGILKEVIDHSDTAQKMRDEIEKHPEEFEQTLHSNPIDFINDSFSTDMKVKAWWIK